MEKNQILKRIKTIDINSLDEGNVTVKVSFSSFNFKDGLKIPGVDFSGTVIESKRFLDPNKRSKVGE